MKCKKIVYTVLIFVAAVFISCNNIAQTESGSSKKVLPPVVKPAQQSDLYGTYWGKLDMKKPIGKLDMCVTLAENELVIYSGFMSFKYGTVTYNNNSDGTWTVCSYDPGKTQKKVTVTVNTKVLPFGATVVIHPMGDTTGICQKGKPYDGRYKKP